VGGFLVLVGLIVGILLRRRKNKKKFPTKIPLEDAKKRESVMTVIKDIKVLNKLGGGHFSDVYRGEWQAHNFFKLKK
jgi:hypothetical protein